MIDNGTSIKRIKEFASVNIPDVDNLILATRGNKGGIRSNCNAVNVTSVSDETVFLAESATIPNTNNTIVTSRNNWASIICHSELGAGDPFIESGGGVLEVAMNVPESHCLITTS